MCGSLPASLPLTCRLAQPTSPAPHGTREGNLARTNARPAALRLRVNRVPGRVSKGWELLQSEALALVAPTQRPSPPRYPPAPLPSSPFLPSGSSSLLSCPCPSSDLFAGLTPFFSRPPKKRSPEGQERERTEDEPEGRKGLEGRGAGGYRGGAVPGLGRPTAPDAGAAATLY